MSLLDDVTDRAKIDDFIEVTVESGAVNQRRFSLSEIAGLDPKFDYRGDITYNLRDLVERDAAAARDFLEKIGFSADAAKSVAPKLLANAQALQTQFSAASTTSEPAGESASAGSAATVDEVLSLPETPPQYAYAPRMPGGIVKYLEDNWAGHIKAGLLTRPELRRVDPAAEQALQNWLRNNELPAHLRILSKSEAIDRQLEALPAMDRHEAERLARAAARRRAKEAAP